MSTARWDERLSQIIDVRQVAYCEFQSVSEVSRSFLPETHWKPVLNRSVFGGILIAQSMEAASKTVDDGMELHVRWASLIPGNSRTHSLLTAGKISAGRR